ncbi:type II toxin-antitoxin system RelE/ParE family toxin [Kumtagia ephedrae]|uniref:Type II toxin-antitoxin system mRNA interferase toxin, RelE/StbE family n=1 Tax=Kumtagia ephedrae TaxID=2116701 RepID=A0A2P7SJ45_9HYPH|nr:type II toxin-antitoxin system RelE/ParE family toxin [Mesorhizobium ephedrae]PSJ62522.1 type II toxin-antitoxin system mRNA interferase toxin, RelE/StbE family [Mesorhizobium ephedrae]
MRVVWLARARIERQKAIDYIARDSPQAALGQLEEIERQTDKLFDFPEIGRPGRKRGTRELVITGTPFLAVYRIRAKAEVQILRLLHGAQRWPPRKRRDR